MITLKDLRILIKPLVNKVANQVARSIVRLVDDSQGLQVMQLEVLQGETRPGVERFQDYGFSSSPPKGSEAVFLSVGGRRDHGLVIAVENRAYRLRNQDSGESAQYNGPAGTSIVLKNNGSIEITTTAGVTVVGDVVADGVSLKNHKHTVAGSLASTPGSVLFAPVGKTGGPTT